MIRSVAVLRETKKDPQGREVESRVVLTPPLVKQLKDRSPRIEVFVEQGAGIKIDFSDAGYEEIGAQIVDRQTALSKDLILGVKETRLEDFSKLANNLWLSYQHFAQSEARTKLALQSSHDKGTTFLALETMAEPREGYTFFPCLAPMSEAAAKIIARHADEFALLSRKIITSGLPETGLHGVKAVILGGGSAGKTAAEEFSERGCEVVVLDKLPARITSLREYFQQNKARYPKVTILEMNQTNLRNAAAGAFFLVSAMYVSGQCPEKLVTRELIKTMASGGCIYPIDIDQGGGVEGVSETSILEPFNLPKISGTEISYFAPANLPSQGARTTSEALGTVILPYLVELINKGLDQAAKDNPVIRSGINVQNGKIVHLGLAKVFPRI